MLTQTGARAPRQLCAGASDALPFAAMLPSPVPLVPLAIPTRPVIPAFDASKPVEAPIQNLPFESLDIDLDKVEVAEGETLEDIKAKLKPKKQTISAEMLDTANTYDDKVAIIRMIVADEAGRVSNVFKAMMKRDLDLIN